MFKRVHQHTRSASEIVFMDATATMDHEGSKVFLLMTHSQCGGLPLGIIITSSENAQNISLGFKMLKKMLGDSIFNGKPAGPQVFMTDDCEAEQIAIRSVWQNSKCLLCIFHVLQAVHRWLVAAKNGIPKDSAMEFFQQFRSIMYAATTTECEQKYNLAIEAGRSFPNYVRYLQTYWQKKDMWALSYRSSLLIRGNNTNNITEAAMRLLKDKIFNLVQLVDFLLSKFVDYYKRRLLDAAHNRSIKNKMFQTIPLPSTDVIQNIHKLNENMYLVPSENTAKLHYIVYTDVLICTCFHGNTGTMCKHINWVHMLYYSEAYYKHIDNMETRSTFFRIATGQAPDAQWLLPLDLVTAEDMVTESHLSPDENQKLTNGDVISSKPLIETINEDNLAEARQLCDKMHSYMLRFAEESPGEMVPVLRKMVERTGRSKTARFASACATFLSGRKY